MQQSETFESGEEIIVAQLEHLARVHTQQRNQPPTSHKLASSSPQSVHFQHPSNWSRFQANPDKTSFLCEAEQSRRQVRGASND